MEVAVPPEVVALKEGVGAVAEVSTEALTGAAVAVVQRAARRAAVLPGALWSTILLGWVAALCHRCLPMSVYTAGEIAATRPLLANARRPDPWGPATD